MIPPRDRLIVALDVPTVDGARVLVATLGDSVSFYKVGLELLFAGGSDYARELKDSGRRVFLDAKLFDIPATVERAVANIARMGVDLLTLHGNAPTVAAAVAGRADAPLKLLAVTVLTSLDTVDLAAMGYRDMALSEHVLHRARASLAAGADGVVASAQEAAALRQLGNLLIVTPGIRRSTDAPGDQKRAATAAQALAAGADHLVVGRPITRAADPRAVAEAFQAEIAAAL